MKKIITSYGFINSIKWNGDWFSDKQKIFSRIILPNNMENNVSSECETLRSLNLENCMFIKKHREGSNSFDSSSLVMNFDSNLLKFKKIEENELGFLWAYKNGKLSFIKYFTLEEVKKFSKN
ncbi:hypothetical protein [Leptospira levettii]|uniref:YopX protein domain-containing protein n=1 Tax=Leptospira levettii TaxID=2023178 RepID=A0AAW5VE39_9LEPT|nr:hypothetical protein [Leptospira levettii]MCW7512119.1 hypothetical protein [Leptospira levettii]MCW7517142.1 hypothetical protein [Leptospira levettii]